MNAQCVITYDHENASKLMLSSASTENTQRVSMLNDVGMIVIAKTRTMIGICEGSPVPPR